MEPSGASALFPSHGGMTNYAKHDLVLLNVIAKEHDSLLTLWPPSAPQCCFLNLISQGLDLHLHPPSHPPSFLPPLFPCSYFMFYCCSYKLSHNFLTVLFKGRPPPFLCFFPLPRPPSSSPFREAPHLTHPVTHSTGTGNSLNTELISYSFSCHQTSAQGVNLASESFCFHYDVAATESTWWQEKATVTPIRNSDNRN